MIKRVEKLCSEQNLPRFGKQEFLLSREVEICRRVGQSEYYYQRSKSIKLSDFYRSGTNNVEK
jgi:hypothetical protein